MKLLVFLTDSFQYEACEAGSPLAPSEPEPARDRVENAIVAFMQCEPRDEERGEAVLKQAVNASCGSSCTKCDPSATEINTINGS